MVDRNCNRYYFRGAKAQIFEYNVSRGYSGIRYRICLETGRNLAGKEDVGIRLMTERIVC